MDKPTDPSDTPVTPSQATDGARVDQRAGNNYYRLFGESYKGHYRGGLTGIAIGGLVGAAVGLAVCALPFVGAAAMIPVVLAMTGIGGMIGADSLSSAGSAANSRAMGLAERHARISDPIYKGDDLAAIDDKLMTDGRGYHYEYPPDRDNGKFYYAKSGIVGAAITGTLGALMGMAGAASEALAPVATIAAHLPVLSLLGPGGAMIAAGALAFGAIGLSFGLDRSKVKSLFNHTDAALSGTVHDGRPGPNLGREQAQGLETEAELAAHRIRRQADITARGNEYGKKILKGTVAGKFRGYAGGAVIGAAVGAAAGLAVFGIMALPALAILAGAVTVPLATAAAVWPSAALLGAVTAGFSAAGTLLGAKIFSEAGAEAGAESTARAIDDEFERNRILKARGITPPAPEKTKEKWFNGKAMLICAAIGAVIGIPMAGVLGLGVLHVLGHVGIAVAATAGAKLAASVATVATIGASFGNGPKTLQFFSNAADKIYENSYHAATGTSAAESIAAPAIETKSAPAHPKISAEEAAKLRENLSAAGSGRSYVQALNTQQMQPQSMGMQT